LFRDPMLRRLCSWTLVSKCCTAHGIKYALRGKRCSGDMDTALGNCLIVFCVIYAMVTALRIRKWDTLIDGDDVLLILERNALTCQQFRLFTLTCGFETTPQIHLHFQSIDFCRSRPVCVNGSWRFVRRPWRAIATFLCSHRHFHDPGFGLRMMKSMALCELVTQLGVPILQPLALAVLKALEATSLSNVFDSDDVYKLRQLNLGVHSSPQYYAHTVAQPITSDTRISFEMAFGISPALQVDIESYFEKYVTKRGLDLATANVLPPSVAPVGANHSVWFDLH